MDLLNDLYSTSIPRPGVTNPVSQIELTKNVEKEGCLDVTGGAVR
jgi:hypothetical protein